MIRKLTTSLLQTRSVGRRTFVSSSSTQNEAAISAASSILSYTDLKPGSVVINIGSETEIGQIITVGASMRGITTINVVGEGEDTGYPETVSHVYALGGDYVVTESFCGFRGMKEMVREVCGDGNTPSLVINGSNMIEQGTTALGPFTKATSFTDRKSAVEDMQDNNTINAAERVGLLSSLLGKNTVIVKHSGSDYKGASKGTKEQDLEFGELVNDLNSVMANAQQ
tara:strand:+ start:309 stop:986 length:678 start_codon:yes stop_codon:yes gene_type:complete